VVPERGSTDRTAAGEEVRATSHSRAALRQLALQSMWKVHRAETLRKVPVVQLRTRSRCWASSVCSEAGSIVTRSLSPLPLADSDFGSVEVEVLHAESEGFEQPEAGTVKEGAR